MTIRWDKTTRSNWRTYQLYKTIIFRSKILEPIAKRYGSQVLCQSVSRPNPLCLSLGINQREKEFWLEECDEEPEGTNWKQLVFHAMMYYLYHDDYSEFALVRLAHEAKSETYDNGILENSSEF